MKVLIEERTVKYMRDRTKRTIETLEKIQEGGGGSISLDEQQSQNLIFSLQAVYRGLTLVTTMD